MDAEINSLVVTTRKLLVGELVEVRQKEIGLRGSWHPAKVVRVKDGRRVVEYDELLTPDQNRRLQESIHLSNDIKVHSTALRLKNGMKAELEKRGFIRPRPPSCPSLPSKNWKQGLLVDAFYDGAWWEGILLDDVHFYHVDSKFKIFFPEEGDELGFLINDLRVSQEWDEGSGQWEIRGYWSLQNEMGKIDLSSLKDICRKRRSSFKKLWRQKRFNGSQVLQVEEQQGLQLSCNSKFEKKLSSFAADGEAACQRGRAFAVENDAMQDEPSTNLAISNEHLGRILQSSSCPSSSEVYACLGTGMKNGNGDVALVGADERFTIASLELFPQEEDEKNRCKKYSSADATESEFSNVQMALNAVAKNVQRKGRKASSRITRSTTTPILESEKLPLSRLLCNMADESSKISLENKNSSQEEKLAPSSPMEKLPLAQGFQSCKLMLTNGFSSNAGQSECKSNSLLASSGGSCLKFHEHQSACVDNDLRGNQVVFSDCSIPYKVRIRQARMAAKQFLMKAGWKLDVRNRARGPLIRQEVVYISPNGSRFFSLAAACRGWKSRGNYGEFLNRGTNKEFELLSAYCMAEDMRCSDKLSGQAKTEPMLFSGLLRGSYGKGSSSLAGCQVSGVVESGMHIVGRKSMDPSDIQKSNCAQVDIRVKKKKVHQNEESQKKRKMEGPDVFSSSEVRRKRGRQSLKRGGCRMQVLLTCPGKNKDFVNNAGDFFQFKKSTVLSWLMDKGILKENDPVSYINRKDGHVMKKGQVTREGVICDCCKEVFTLSNFEAHAGSKLHRPSANTFLDDGRSISDCQLEACAFQDVKEKESLMEISDDTCGVCGDGGELVLCDHCPSTFHADCIGLEVIPEGDWYCPRCCCGICGSNQFSAHDIDDGVHRCGQCELEYHLICAQGHTVLATPGGETSTWFCDQKCKEIFSALRALVGISYSMENGFSWTLLRSMKKDQGLSPSSLEEMAEHHSKLSVAHGVMQECFVPMIDPRTNINLLSQAIYNRRSRVTRLNYSGFYTIVLERGDEIISAATIRVHGARLAEMPLVGTRYQYRRQGMCRRLMHALEEMLRSIGVEKLILPAVPELLDTWMGAFRFMKLSPQETRELSKLSLMTFPGTTLLQKYLPAGTKANGSLCLSNFVNKADHMGGPPCKSITAFFSMARASLDSRCGNAFVVGSHSGQSSSANLNVVKHTPQSVGSFLSGDPQTPATLEALKGKNRLKSDHFESPGDGLMNKVRKDDDIYSSVVIATTRSNRLVKSRRWVADGLKELKNTKQSKRTPAALDPCSELAVDLNRTKLFESLAHSDVGQAVQNVETFYVRTRKKTPISMEGVNVLEAQRGQESNWLCSSDPLFRDSQKHYKVGLEVGSSLGLCDDFVYSGNHRVDGLHVDKSSLDIQTEDKLSVCPKFYSRRKKKDIIHSNFTGDSREEFTTNQNAEEQSLCASVITGMPCSI